MTSDALRRILIAAAAVASSAALIGCGKPSSGPAPAAGEAGGGAPTSAGGKTVSD